MKVSVLNVALNTMYNAEKRGKRQALIRPSSKVITKYLLVMQKHGITMAPLLRTSHHICISISNFDSFVKLILFESGGERLFERDCAGADGFGMSASQDDFNKSGRKTLADILLASPTKSETEYLKLNDEKELVSEEENI